MTYVKYFWGFDSAVEGWTGDNVVWEAGGYGGLPTGHIYGYHKASSSYSKTLTFPVTFKSPRNLSVNNGDLLCFVFTWDGSVYDQTGKGLANVTVEVVDATGTVVWSKTIGVVNSPANTPTVCIVKLESSGVGINIKINITTSTYDYGVTHTHYARLDSVTIYSQPDQILHVPIPATVQATLTFDIPINRTESCLVSAIRSDSVQNVSSYNEKLIYDTSSSLDYGNGVCKLVNVTTSVDKVTITINADSTLQVYYECDHAVWLLDPNTYYPKWLAIIKCYHNQNVTNPDTVSFSTILSNTTYTDTQSVSFKFTANGIFNCVITPSAQVIGDTTGITSVNVTISVKDANGNVIGTCNYDVLNDTYDQAITVPNSYDNQDLTIEITVNASGNASETVTIYLNLKFDFKT